MTGSVCRHESFKEGSVLGGELSLDKHNEMGVKEEECNGTSCSGTCMAFRPKEALAAPARAKNLGALTQKVPFQKSPFCSPVRFGLAA